MAYNSPLKGFAEGSSSPRPPRRVKKSVEGDLSR
jgi:hypothetical protein